MSLFLKLESWIQTLPVAFVTGSFDKKRQFKNYKINEFKKRLLETGLFRRILGEPNFLILKSQPIIKHSKAKCVFVYIRYIEDIDQIFLDWYLGDVVTAFGNISLIDYISLEDLIQMVDKNTTKKMVYHLDLLGL